ncbi:TWiK family of potassium channels protein 7 [Lepeophtheirus salmonis]|uniref:TWiK family of potassium channels protein 7 n=1 Tax=Lepeophtheirus salmonis TaxID=72036 RepID=UPI001AEA77B1|nr:potassium channel subfamily K member 2-like [Lepeophtheirus salmonis]
MNPFMGLSTTINCSTSNAKVILVRCLVLCFINITLVLFGGLLFQCIEGSYELAYKCGVKRVHRDFIDNLWNETTSLDEIDWKSSARNKLMNFENELHEAVEAGVYSYSGQKSWTLANSILYTFSVISTMGFGPLSCSTRLCRIFTYVFVIIGTPLFYLFITELATLSILLYNLYVTKKETTSLIQPVESLTCLLGYTMVSLGVLYTFLCFINPPGFFLYGGRDHFY